MFYTIYKEKEPDEYSVFIYIPDILDDTTYNELSEWLNSRNYKSGFGVKSKPIPRKQLWYQEDKQYFCKKWKSRLERWESETYDDFLYLLQKKVCERIRSMMPKLPDSKYIDLSFDINSCLVNYYRHGYDSIHPHRDSIHSFGLYPTIIGLSIGATRMMNIERVQYNCDNIRSCKKDRENEQGIHMMFPLADNSVFIMMGSSQKYYTHEIIKEPHIIEPRYSLTFRKYIDL